MKIEDFKKKNEEQIFVIDGGEQPPLLKYKKLEEIPWIRHCFTTREGGASKGIFAELNLSFTRGDEEAAVRENYRRVWEQRYRILCAVTRHIPPMSESLPKRMQGQESSENAGIPMWMG